MVIINSKAKIVSGKNIGWFIWVQDDRKNTGGYLVLQSPDIDFKGDGFDNWFLTIEEIENYFFNNNWILEWI